MFQFIIVRSSEPLSICLISSGQLKMEFRLEAVATLSSCTLSNTNKNYKNTLLPIVKSTVKVCDCKSKV